MAQAADDVRRILDDPEVDVVDLVRSERRPRLDRPRGGAGGQARHRREAAHRVLRRCVARRAPRCSARRSARPTTLIEACRAAGVRLCYAENWVYAPPIQKARRLLAAAGGPILRLVGEESHSGTHAPANKRWVTAGGGSLLGKGCHPLGGILYLKADEGRRLRGRPVRPCLGAGRGRAARRHRRPSAAATPRYLNTVAGADVEDWGGMLLRFDDGTVAQISAADVVLGGIRNQLQVYAAKAVIFCNMNPNDAVQAYAPDPTVFGAEYITEKIETKAGWTFPQPDEDWMTGYPGEIQDFVESVALGREPISGGPLARDVLAVTYAAYLSAAEGRRVELGPYLR